MSSSMRLRLADQGTLAGRASRALGWNFTSNALGRLGTMGVGIVLARLLGPHAFGTYAVAWVALLAVLSFNDLSVGLAIVRWPGDPAEIAPTVATISVVSSVAVYVGCFVGAPAYTAAMGAPAATGVIRVLALSVILDGVTATPVALLERHFRQDRKMIADQVNNWLGAAVSVGLAWAGLGAMSLALGRITGAVAACGLYVAFAPEPLRFGFDRARARALLRYGTPLAGSAIIVFAVTNVDQLVVGRMLGATALGFYVLAANLAAWPVTIFSRPVRSVAPATFSRLQHDQTAMRRGFLSAAALLGAVTLPVCLMISGSAVPLIGFAYGVRWLYAAQALVWLSLLAALRIFFELTYDYFVVLARTRVVFTVQLAWLVVLIPALVAAAHAGGIGGVSAAEVAVAACVILPWYLHELRRVGIRRRTLGARLWLPLTGAAVAGLAAAGAARVAPNYLTALAASGLASLAVIGLLIARMRKVFAMLRPLAGQQGPGSSAPAPGSAAALGSAAGPESAAGPGSAAALVQAVMPELVAAARAIPDPAAMSGRAPSGAEDLREPADAPAFQDNAPR
ncbi:MAG TPA: oligosaccharide flippase family protein, partial [Streptosporangiaceae bacterium]